MHPVICSIGPFTVYSFGLMIAVAALVCSYFFGRDTQKAGIPKETAYDFVFWSALFGILGARVFYILLNLDLYENEPLEMFKLQNGGLAWQGGLIFAVVHGVIYLKRHKLPVWVFADLAAPYCALGQAIGRVGCFLNGCCYGKPVWWGVSFPGHDAHLHPTQIYEAVGLLAAFLFLKKLNAVKLGDGRVFAAYLMIAATLRFVVQFFRDDHDPVWFRLSVFQWVCIGVFLSAIILFMYLKRTTKAV